MEIVKESMVRLLTINSMNDCRYFNLYFLSIAYFYTGKYLPLIWIQNDWKQ